MSNRGLPVVLSLTVALMTLSTTALAAPARLQYVVNGEPCACDRMSTFNLEEKLRGSFDNVDYAVRAESYGHARGCDAPMTR
jgi:hypothetical protein